jgi:glycosyltransferase involved in cell wall biosynthesis
VPKIGITTSFLGNLRAGTWQYTRHLLAGVAGREGFAALDRQSRKLPEIDLQTFCYPGGGEKLAKLTWPNLVLPGRASRDNFDLVHCTTPYGTFMPCRYKNVITICDVTPLLFPGAHGRMNVWHHRYALPAILKRADRIITISECSKRDIVRTYTLPPDKVTVTLLAADERYRPSPEGTPGKSVAELPRPYILNVGTLEPRKNLEGLLRAFARAKRAGIPHTLVIAGARGWGESRLARLPDELGIADSVIFLGFIEDHDLPHLYANAAFFVYPSLYEGFGLPVLEAMACGTSVITAHTSSLPEVAADAALLIDPCSDSELAAAIIRLAGDLDVCNELAAKGIKQAASFSWDRTVADTVAVYAALLE